MSEGRGEGGGGGGKTDLISADLSLQGSLAMTTRKAGRTAAGVGAEERHTRPFVQAGIRRALVLLHLHGYITKGHAFLIYFYAYRCFNSLF